MPIRRKRASRKPRRRNNRKTRVPRGMGRSAGPSIAVSDRGQFASIIETIDEGASSLPNVIQNNFFSLLQFDRAKALACQFQYYRAKKVTYVYTPLYNTYQEGGGAPSKPYIYNLMNRTQQFMLGGLPQLQHSGSRPKPFVSVVKLTYTPNWCSPGLVARTNVETAPIVNVGNQAEYGWLTTPFSDPGSGTGAFGYTIEGAQSTALPDIDLPAIVPNAVVYNGHTTYVDQPGSTSPVYNLIIQVHWEFKGAHFSAQKGSS